MTNKPQTPDLTIALMKKYYLLKSIKQRLITWIIVATIALFFLWSSFASLDEIVRGPGKVVPSSRTQIIQNLEGGILAKLFVKEGDIVMQGDKLARLNDVRFKGTFRELQEQYFFLKIKFLRLSAELKKYDVFEIPKELSQKAPDIAYSEKQLFQARISDYRSTLQSAIEAVSLRDQEVAMLQPLKEKNVVAPIDVLRARQAGSEERAKLEAIESDYHLKLAQEYAETLSELNKVNHTLSVREDQLKRTLLVSPVRGIINKVLITTIGGVVGPGKEIIEIIPLGDELLIEARVPPKDIAFLYPGMRATIKFSAYDYTIHGSFSGRVEHISADTFEENNYQDREPYYEVIIKVEVNPLKNTDKELVIRPGMLANVELHTGEKTVLQYLLKPLFKATEAFRER